MKRITVQNQRAITICVIGVLALTLMLTFNNSVSSKAGYFLGTTGTGFDALTAQEKDNVLSATLGAIADPDLVSAAAVSTQEILLVERHQETKDVYQSANWPRRGDAYIYDYATDTLTFALINLDTGQVDAIEENQGVQLPLTENEMNRALEISYANAALRTNLEAQFKAITGQNLQNLNQLNVKAFVFRADSMPENLNGAAMQCGLHRCAQLLLFTNEDISFEIQPIIDLSAGQVVQVLGQ